VPIRHVSELLWTCNTRFLGTLDAYHFISQRNIYSACLNLKERESVIIMRVLFSFENLTHFIPFPGKRQRVKEKGRVVRARLKAKGEESRRGGFRC